MPESWSTSGVDLHLQLDSAQGRRAALEQALRDAIRAGRLAPRARLPSTRGLAAETGLSRGTVQAAYEQLVAEGYLAARHGAGTEVADVAPGGGSVAAVEADVSVAPAYDLRPGGPDVSSFPTAAWLRATRQVLGSMPASAFDYGDPRGRPELRQALADYLGRTRGVVASPERIVVTSGYVQALALLTRVLADAGTGRIAMEDPGLGIHREVVRRSGGLVVPAAVDDLGICLVGEVGADAVVVTAAHHYPTGVALHPSRRRSLVSWARDSGGLVVEDDYDGEFRYDRQPVGAVQGMAPDDVVYIGSASKTLGPGLRLGWMVLPRRLVPLVAEAKRYADHHTEVVGQLVLASLIGSHGYDRHIRASRLRYQRRREMLVALVGARGSRPRPRFFVSGAAAGLHALLHLGDLDVSEADVSAAASRRGLAIGFLGDYWQTAGVHPQALVVGYGTPSTRSYPHALGTLARVLDEVAGP